jgi:hypothetical protein
LREAGARLGAVEQIDLSAVVVFRKRRLRLLQMSGMKASKDWGPILTV